MSEVKVTQADRDFASRWACIPQDHAPLAKDAARHRQSATAPLIAALERVAHETRRQQLPITALVHEIAQEALAKHKGNSDGQG